MDRRSLIAGGAMFSATAALAAPRTTRGKPSLRDQILGAWQLVDAETVNEKTGETTLWAGRQRPYSGMIVYTPDGFMSVQISAARPRPRADAKMSNLSIEERAGQADTYYAYFGTFDIDEAASKVRHRVEHSLFEIEAGLTFVRRVQLADGILILTTDNRMDGPKGATFNRLTWKRPASLSHAA